MFIFALLALLPGSFGQTASIRVVSNAQNSAEKQVDLFCDLDSDSDYSSHNVSAIRFWIWSDGSASKVLYELQRDCTTGLEAVSPVRDTTGGRIVQLGNGGKAIRWNNLQQQEVSKTYKCSVKLCSATPEVFSHNKVSLRALSPPKPIMLYPAELNTTVFENVVTVINFTCFAFVSYPFESLLLQKMHLVAGNLWLFETIHNFSVSSSGSYKGNFSYSHAYSRNHAEERLACLTLSHSHSSGSEDYRISEMFAVYVEFAPRENVFSSNSSTPVIRVEANEFRMVAHSPLNVNITCSAAGKPAPEIEIVQVSGPYEYVHSLANGSAVNVNYESQSQVELRFECYSTYESSVEPVRIVQLLSFLTVLVYPSPATSTPELRTNVHEATTSSSSFTKVNELQLSILLLILVQYFNGLRAQ